MPGRRGLWLGPVAVQVRGRYLLALALVLALGAAVVTVSLSTGSVALPLERLWAGMTGAGTATENLIAGKRLVRVLGALLVGFALGSAGGITQSLTRNPLASPDVLGINAGAGVLAVSVIVSPITGVAAATAIPAAALVGGLGTTAVVVALAWRRGLDPVRLVLTGVGITALCGALTEWLLLRAQLESAAVAMRWLTGSVAGVGWSDVTFLGAVCVLGVVATAMLSRPLGQVRLGNDLARSLGTRPQLVQIGALVVAVALASFATAVAGPVAFVAFVAPQVAMRLFRTAGPPVLAAGVTGAVLTAAADYVARNLPVDLPVGVIPSLVGGPMLLVLLFRYVRRTSA